MYSETEGICGNHMQPKVNDSADIFWGIYIELICHDLFTGPGQPVMDLESYMGSLEKKQQSMQKMMGVLQSSSDGMATKFFDQIVISYHIKNNCQLPLSGYMMAILSYPLL